MYNGAMQTIRENINEEYIVKGAQLPYGLTVNEVIAGVDSTYGLLYDINDFLINKGVPPLEELLLGNSFSGIVSELLVKNTADNSQTLARNKKVGGHPDLVLANKYPEDSVLRADEGIEVKTSRRKGGWQGHNPEDCWLIIFRYELGENDPDEGVYQSIEFVQVLAAHMSKDDWSFSGRTGASRRTITASLTREGVGKLRRNPIYQNPDYIVGSSKREKEELLNIQKRLSGE